MGSSKVLAPSGGDYTDINTWQAAVAEDLVTNGGDAVLLCQTFSGGNSSNSAFTGSWTTGTNNRIIIKADTGHEPDFTGGTLKAGFYFSGSSNTVIRPVTGVDHFTLQDIEWDGAANATLFRESNGGGLNPIFTRIICVGGSGDALIHNGLANATYEGLLIVNPGDDGILVGGTLNHCTVVGAGNRGIVAVSGSACTNCFCFGSTGSDFDNQGGSHGAVATEDTTGLPGTTWDGRTSADFANYAGGDYRIASGSALATGGSGGTYIGHALQPAAGGATPKGVFGLALRGPMRRAI